MQTGSRLMLRIAAPVVAVSGMLLALGAVAAWYVHELQDSSSDILVVNVSSVRAAEEIEIGMREVRTLLNRFLRSGDRKYLEACRPIREETHHWMGEAERLSTTPKETELMSQARRGYEQFFREFDDVAARITGKLDQAAQDEVERLIDDVLTQELLEPVHQYLDLNEELMATTSRENQKVTDWMVFALLLLGTCGAVAGLIAGLGIARGVNRSIVQLTVPIRDAAGKLNEVVGPLTVATGGSFTEIEDALRHVGDQIGTVVERLRKSEREMLRAEQLAAVGQLAAGVAHELRNPLMSMKLLVQTAIESGDNARLEGRDLRVLDDVVRRVERSVQSLLEFARPPRLEMARFDVKDVVRQTVALVESRAEQRNVCIDCDVAESASPVWADQGQMRQLVLNLLLNALDAAPQGGHVGVRVRFDDAQTPQPSDPLKHASAHENGGADTNTAGLVTLSVLDDGDGLPSEFGDRIFEPFVSTKETGTGLGLSICRRIVEAHGGAIHATNRVTGGAEFVVRLPVSAEAINDNQESDVGESPDLRRMNDADVVGRG